MKIWLTDWAVKSYTKLVKSRLISKKMYDKHIRPETLKLKHFPHDPKLARSSPSWGPVTLKGGVPVPHCYKLKWRGLGPNQLELRVIVVVFRGAAYICEGYIKTSPQEDKRRMLRSLEHKKVIFAGNAVTVEKEWKEETHA